MERKHFKRFSKEGPNQAKGVTGVVTPHGNKSDQHREGGDTPKCQKVDKKSLLDTGGT